MCYSTLLPSLHVDHHDVHMRVSSFTGSSYPKLLAHVPYRYGHRSLRSACAYQDAHANHMHRSQRKATPYPGFRQRLLPVRACHGRMRGLLLGCPKGFHHVGAGVLVMCCVEEEFEDDQAGDWGDEGVEEEEVGEYDCKVRLALHGGVSDMRLIYCGWALYP